MKKEPRSSWVALTSDTMRFLGQCAKSIENSVSQPSSQETPSNLTLVLVKPFESSKAETPAVINNEVARLTISETEECLRAKVYIRDFSSSSKPARLGALNQIKRLSKPIAKIILKKLLAQEKDTLKQVEVLGALATCNGKIEGDRGFLRAYLSDVNSEIRLSALRVFSKYEDEECFEILSQAIKDPQADIRREVLNLMCRIYGLRATPLIMRLLHDVDDSVRKSAITLCSTFESRDAVGVLITMLNDQNMGIQKDVKAALEKITKHSIVFDVNGSKTSRDQAYQAWILWWVDHQADH